MNKYPTYSVSLRTLGTAGEKYQETLNSIARQTVKPEKVCVYIPWGYDIPKETIGIEEYIRCEKGMVSQRSLPFNEIQSEFILFLDDDLSFGADFVEKLFIGLITHNGDCICPDIYSLHRSSFIIKVRDFFGGTLPHHKKDWSFIVRLDGHYSYNSHPRKDVLLSQSGAGACSLCRKKAYEAIHFADERWIDQFHFGLGEDQLFFFKLYKYGFTLLTSNDAVITHLDAGSGHEINKRNSIRAAGFCRYMIWYRTIYSENNTFTWQLRCKWALVVDRFRSFPLSLAILLKYRFSPFKASQEGANIAKDFIRSGDYLELPSYYEHKRP